jgi:hypothetical protein
MCSVAPFPRRDRHVNPRPTLTPVQGKLARRLPEGRWLYEPKWDGFRALSFRDGDEVDIAPGEIEAADAVARVRHLGDPLAAALGGGRDHRLGGRPPS